MTLGFCLADRRPAVKEKRKDGEEMSAFWALYVCSAFLGIFACVKYETDDCSALLLSKNNEVTKLNSDHSQTAFILVQHMITVE
jgi:hypothetical protein